MRLPTRSKSSTYSKSDFAAVRGRICRRLKQFAIDRPDYWNFTDKVKDVVSQKLFQYPAMMVPALQKQVISAVLKVCPATSSILDPFVGSGTVLMLAMMNGRSFVGQDINPLAILIAKTRAFSLDYTALHLAVTDVAEAVAADQRDEHDVRFIGQSKWFTDGASLALTKLRQAIRSEAAVTTRRFLWVCLAEAIRLNSNSRTSTFKLHTKPVQQRNASEESTLKDFQSIAARNLVVVEEFVKCLKIEGYIKCGRYKHKIAISYGDSASNVPAPTWEKNEHADLIVTSPPYGDNRTTVPYGQASWLPLKWIDISDIDECIPKEAAKLAYDVDNRSLGGIRKSSLLKERVESLAQVGPRTDKFIQELKGVASDGLSRFAHFANDLQSALRQAAARCRIGGSIVLTTGHRNISGKVCPLTDVCSEMLMRDGFKEFIRIDRQIQSKRMAKSNGHSATITHEYITILRKEN